MYCFSCGLEQIKPFSSAIVSTNLSIIKFRVEFRAIINFESHQKFEFSPQRTISKSDEFEQIFEVPNSLIVG